MSPIGLHLLVVVLITCLTPAVNVEGVAAHLIKAMAGLEIFPTGSERVLYHHHRQLQRLCVKVADSKAKTELSFAIILLLGVKGGLRKAHVLLAENIKKDRPLNEFQPQQKRTTSGARK